MPDAENGDAVLACISEFRLLKSSSAAFSSTHLEVMQPYRGHLLQAEEMVGIPLMVQEFDAWGEDIRRYIEEAWPSIAEKVLFAHAAHLHNAIWRASPIEIKLFFALHRHFVADFLNYPDSTALLVNRRLSEISGFLRRMGQAEVYLSGDVDFEIDLFFYHGGYGVHLNNGRFVPYPFFVAIECDGHDYHERTKEQARKDRAKDRILKNRGVDVLRFTGSEITRSPDGCVTEVRQLLSSHLGRMKQVMDLGSAR